MDLKIEEQLRRPDWQPGCPIRLLNGETFHFRPPVLRQWREPGPDGVWQTSFGTNYGDEYDRCLNDCESLISTSGDILPHVYYFADCMLAANYIDNIRNYYKHILYFNTEDHVKIVWWKIYDLARGIDPKEITSTG